MSDGYKPTNRLRWQAIASRDAGRRPASIPLDMGGGPQVTTRMVLQQQWVSDFVGEDPEWRDVDFVPIGHDAVSD